jgi:hypothetical protein
MFAGAGALASYLAEDHLTTDPNDTMLTINIKQCELDS